MTDLLIARFRKLFSYILSIVFLVSGFVGFGISGFGAPEDIVISEFEYDTVQSGNDNSYEWIELYNKSSSPQDLSNWYLQDFAGVTTTIPNGTVIAGNGFILLANNITNFQINYPSITPEIDLSPSIGLNNTGDFVRLYDDTNTERDFVAWEGQVSGWNLAEGADNNDSACRSDEGVDSNDPSDWMVCPSPTPGFTNLTTYEISGLVFHDEDGEGDLDAGETGRLQDIAISLYDDNSGASSGNGVFDGDEAQIGSSTDTAVDGTYSFSSVSNGSYFVVVDIADTNLNRDANNGPVSTYGITTPQEIFVNINNGDQTDQNFGFDNAFLELTSVTPASISEEGGSAVWTLTQSIATGFTTDIGRELAGSTATFLQDFSLSGDIRIFPGETTSTFTSTGISDDIVEGDETIVVTLGLNFGGSNAELGSTISQTITLADDDVAGVDVNNNAGITIIEGVSNGTFDVVLESEPLSDVVIDVTSSDIGAVTVLPSSLTFSSGDWETQQAVTISPVSDDDLVDENVIITFSVDDSASDDEYDPILDINRNVIVQDNDIAEIIVSPANLIIDEALTDTFEISLSAEPTTDVVIDIVSSDNGAATVSNSTITFDSTNWNIPQVLTVTTLDDNDALDNNLDILINVDDANSDDDFDGLNSTVDVIVVDGDTDTDGDGEIDSLDLDDDGDGVSDIIEITGLNNGDGNGDSIIDSLQSNVANIPNPVTGNNFVLEVDSACSILNLDFVSMTDINFDSVSEGELPVGLHDFELDCGAPGQTININIIWGDLYDTSDWVYKKYDNGLISNIDGQVIYDTVNLSGNIYTTNTYQITDGGLLDGDGIANGTIVDPAGPFVLAKIVDESQVPDSSLIRTGGYSL